MKVNVYDYRDKDDRDGREKEGTFYAYTFMFDPFILNATGAIPELCQSMPSNTDLLICPVQLPTDCTDQLQVLQSAKMLLVYPRHETYDVLRDLSKIAYVEELMSLRERWTFKVSDGGTYYYPEKFRYQRAETEGCPFFGAIRERPDHREHGQKVSHTLYGVMKRKWDEGKIEVVDGTYSQPYTHFYSLESNIRQFEVGLRVIDDIFGRPTVTHVRQEFGLTPQLPQILVKTGFKYVLHGIMNNGDTRIIDREKIWWRGSDDSRIEALPSHRDKVEKNSLGMLKTMSEMIKKDYESGYKYAAFTNVLDQQYPHFREEAARCGFYAPVLGEFMTYKQFFESTPKPTDEKTFTTDDYSLILLF